MDKDVLNELEAARDEVNEVQRHEVSRWVDELKEFGIPLRDVAAVLGISYPYLYSKARGVYDWTPKELRLLRELYEGVERKKAAGVKKLTPRVRGNVIAKWLTSE